MCDYMYSLYVRSGNTLMHCCARDGDVSFMQQIHNLHPTLMEQKNNNNESPLHVAASQGHLDVVKILLQEGVQATQVDRNGMLILLVDVCDYDGWMPQANSECHKISP